MKNESVKRELRKKERQINRIGERKEERRKYDEGKKKI